MAVSPEKRGIVPLLLGLASLVLVVAGMRAISGLLSPILLSLFVVMVTSPLMQWLKARRVTQLAGLYPGIAGGDFCWPGMLIFFLAASLAQLVGRAAQLSQPNR
jgi:AI-2 transport protein TqsA